MNYNDINIIPRELSEIKHREDVNLNTEINDITLSLPIISAPMDTVGGINMCKFLGEQHILSSLHRFTTLDIRMNNVAALSKEKNFVFVTVGVEEFFEADSFWEQGVRNFLIDTANGFNSRIEKIIKHIKSYPDTMLIAGNVASKEGFEYLANLNVDMIRVGIGTGSMCTTSVMTGIGHSMPDTIIECYENRKSTNPLIIADGGITNVGEIAKSLWVGADLVMLGRLFAGTAEAEGTILKYNDKLYKKYRGLASFAVQAEHKKESPHYVEGDETIVPYKGSAKKVIQQIDSGLRSSLSYMNAKNIEEFKAKRR